MTRAVDYTALTAPVTPAEWMGFRTAMRGRPEYSTAGATAAVVALVVVSALFGGFMLLMALALFVFFVSQIGQYPIAALGLVIPVGLVGVCVLLVWLTIRAASSNRWEAWYRFDRFAAANALIFSPVSANPQYPGALFQSGYGRKSTTHFRSATDRFLDYGTFQFETGSGKNHSTHTRGFLALALDRSLPHMVLDSLSNNGIFGGSNLAIYDKSQVLSLEGDFNRYFTLYCPQQYERDALYVFTPDLMALLIDNLAPFDVEIIDKWMFVYSSAPFDVRQPAVHHRLFSIIDTVGAKTLTQTDRYSDERVGNFAANVVAPPGQRLRRRFPLALLIVVAVVVALAVLPVVGGMIALLFSR